MFTSSPHQSITHQLLQYVANGAQDQAEFILQRYPSCMMIRGNVTDPSGRKFINITAFELAKCMNSMLMNLIKSIFRVLMQFMQLFELVEMMGLEVQQ
jgi:hypothetical protein